MNQRILVIACVALLPSLALATGNTTPAASPEAHADADAAATADAHARAKAEAEQHQTAEAKVGDFSIDTTYKERLQAPSVNAPPIYASGSCAYGSSFSVNAPGVGLGGGKAKPDPSCDRRELVRVVAPLNPWLALSIACEDPIVVDMLARGVVKADACKYVPPAPPENVAGEAGPPAQVKAAPVADQRTPAEITKAREEARQDLVRKTSK